MLLEFFKALALAGAVAVTAVVYKEILFREPILNWWLRFGERWERRWFFKPIWGCHKCIAGQAALWLYLFTRFNISIAGVSIHAWGTYSLIWHLFAICAAILFAELIKNHLDKQ